MTDVFASQAAAPRKRPRLVTVCGIITIIFCSLNLIMTGWSLISSLTFDPSAIPNQYPAASEEGLRGGGGYDDMLKISAKFRPISTGVEAVQIAATLGGLFGGILLLASRRAGVKLCLLYAPLALCLLVIGLVVSVLHAVELKNALLAGIGSPEILPLGSGNVPIGILDTVMVVYYVISAVWGCSWPILLLIFMNAKSVKGHFKKDEA